jgi:Reverse transcriptase (RNA-dependent DNA polymerase)
VLQQYGQNHSNHRQKAHILFNYFRDLICTDEQVQTRYNLQQLYGAISQITDLTTVITSQEINHVIDNWLSHKAPGPDGFTGEFYKAFRQLIVPDLLATYNSVLTQPNQTLEPLNRSYIVMIPKKKNATDLGDYRPISVINAIQRILSKILAARLQPHMSGLLQPTQTGFLKGRHILEGFYYAQEIVTAATKQSKQIALFKADIYKAFDSLNWVFIKNCLAARGFSHIWITWIQNLVLQGHSQVTLNSVAGRRITLKRGVRQGDPLSPYLFNITMDVLALWIQRLNERRILKPIYIGCRSCLLYADDTLIFVQPTAHQLNLLKILLDSFGNISGLKINMQQSELLVTSTTSPQVHN